MPAKRTDRVGALLKSALAELLLREVKDPRVRMVTVTGVDVSPDLKHARVFVSALGDDATRARSLAGLASARAYLQSHAGRKIGLRFTPELRFELDPSFAAGERVEQLLRELHPPGAPPSVDAPPDEGDPSEDDDDLTNR
jgi:ribosome-binding factor A